MKTELTFVMRENDATSLLGEELRASVNLKIRTNEAPGSVQLFDELVDYIRAFTPSAALKARYPAAQTRQR